MRGALRVARSTLWPARRVAKHFGTAAAAADSSDHDRPAAQASPFSAAQASSFSASDVAFFRSLLCPGRPAAITLYMPGIESTLHIVGVAHRCKPSIEVVRQVIAQTKPDVTLLEVHPDHREVLARPNDRCEMAAAAQHPLCGRVELIDQANNEAMVAYMRSMPIEQLLTDMLALDNSLFSQQFGFEHPHMRTPITDEYVLNHRDRVMAKALANRLRQPRSRSVAVVGRAHLPGIVHLLASGAADECEPQPPSIANPCNDDMLRKAACMQVLYGVWAVRALPRCLRHVLIALSVCICVCMPCGHMRRWHPTLPLD